MRSAEIQPPRVVITGAAGRIGRVVAAGLHGAGIPLRLTDRAAPPEDLAGIPFVAADLLDADAMARVMSGADTLVHLGGAAGYINDWETLEQVNIVGTRVTFEAAVEAGIRRIVYASSNHVCGFNPADELLGSHTPIRPDGLYAVTKLFGENLLSYICDSENLVGVSLRICSFAEKPRQKRHLSTWLSHKDMVALVKVAIAIEAPGHHVLWGVSNNRRSNVDREPWIAHGYEPEDDADNQSIAPSLENNETPKHLGGSFAIRSV